MIKTIKEFIWGKAPVLWYPDERIFEVADCDNMKSCIGMETQGLPTLKSRFVIKRGNEFRTITPESITETAAGFEVKTNKLTLVLKQKN